MLKVVCTTEELLKSIGTVTKKAAGVQYLIDETKRVTDAGAFCSEDFIKWLYDVMHRVKVNDEPCMVLEVDIYWVMDIDRFSELQYKDALRDFYVLQTVKQALDIVATDFVDIVIRSRLHLVNFVYELYCGTDYTGVAEYMFKQKLEDLNNMEFSEVYVNNPVNALVYNVVIPNSHVVTTYDRDKIFSALRVDNKKLKVAYTAFCSMSEAIMNNTNYAESRAIGDSRTLVWGMDFNNGKEKFIIKPARMQRKGVTVIYVPHGYKGVTVLKMIDELHSMGIIDIVVWSEVTSKMFLQHLDKGLTSRKLKITAVYSGVNTFADMKFKVRNFAFKTVDSWK